MNQVTDEIRQAVSPPPTPQTEAQITELTNSARKRRKQEFKQLNNLNINLITPKKECEDEEMDNEDDEIEPPIKITRLNNVNSCVLDDETVEKLSKG